MKNKAICICLAHNYSHFDKRFVISLLSMMNYFHDWERKAKNDYTISVLVQGGYQLDWMRNEVTEQALNSGHDLLLYLDTDMTFPIETIPRMLICLESNPNFDGVSGIYHNTSAPHTPHIYHDWDDKQHAYRCIYSGFPMEQPFPISACGAGVMMVKKEIFKKDRPWFKFVKPDEIDGLPHGLGEDLFFCWNLRPKLLCDPKILCGHFKNNIITTEDYINFNKGKKVNNTLHITKKQLKEIERMKGKTIILKE